MALERVPADIRAQGGVARMSDPSMIKEIIEAVTIPVMAKARIGHFVECQVISFSFFFFFLPFDGRRYTDHAISVKRRNTT